jgi:hypothetical protein
LERLEEVKLRRGVGEKREEREREVKASKDQRKRARRDASNGPMASSTGPGQVVRLMDY